MRKLLRYAGRRPGVRGHPATRGEEEVRRPSWRRRSTGSERLPGRLLPLTCQALPSERMALELMGSDEAGQERAASSNWPTAALRAGQVRPSAFIQRRCCNFSDKAHPALRFGPPLPLKLCGSATSSARCGTQRWCRRGCLVASCPMRCGRTTLAAGRTAERAADLPGLISQQLGAQGRAGAPVRSGGLDCLLAHPGPAIWELCSAVVSMPAPCRSGLIRRRPAAIRHGYPAENLANEWWGNRCSPGRAGAPNHFALRPRLQRDEPDGSSTGHQLHTTLWRRPAARDRSRRLSRLTATRAVTNRPAKMKGPPVVGQCCSLKPGAAFGDLPENGSLISSPPWVSMAWGVFL